MRDAALTARRVLAIPARRRSTRLPDKMLLRVTGKTVRIDSAKVTKADVMASNGVVHVIDRVLIPPKA